VRDEPQANLPLLQRLSAWIEQGQLHPQATTIHPMEEAPALLQALLERRSVGKPVIRITAT
jgi:NADPH-dependent curcumin reductase CurA